jgi:branched-chain amino acid aminotransferase
MKNQTLISINGKITSPEQAMISVFDRGFLFGDSIYEATLLKNSTPLFWQDHIHRLHNSANLIGLPLNFNLKQIEKWIEQLISEFKHPLGYLRLVITRGEGPVNLAPHFDIKNNIVIYLSPLNYPEEWYTKGLKFFISSYERNSIKALNPKAKTGNYLNSQLALMEGKSKGFDDALLINAKGFITEGTTNNFWFIKNNSVYTSDSNQGLLEGITRNKIFEIVKDLGLQLQVGAWSIEQVLTANESFMTSSTKGVVPIVQLSQWKVGDGKPGTITQKIRSSYESLVDEYCSKNNWKIN